MGNGESSYHRFLNGDKGAFSEIIDIYRKNLIFFINRYLNNLSLSEELAEDCFVELIVHPHRFNFKNSLKTYLFTIARNKAVDLIRKNRLSMPDGEELLLNASEDYVEFEEEIFKNEEKKLLHSSMHKLNSDYLTALHLIYFEDMSYETAGKVMKKSRKQMENIVYRAKIALRTVLEKEGYKYEG